MNVIPANEASQIVLEAQERCLCYPFCLVVSGLLPSSVHPAQVQAHRLDNRTTSSLQGTS
jgi:hypothetical protein